MRALMRKAGPSATDMIRADHTRVMVLFHRYKADAKPATKKFVANAISNALLVHARIEEEIFYPAMRAAGSTLLDELEPEHQEVRTLIATLSGMQATDPQFDLTFMELMRSVIHHVADEETMLLAHAETVLAGRLGEIGAQMAARRLQLKGERTGETARRHPAGALAMAAGALLAGLWLVRRA
jgi:hemerythrin superfamily protein